MKQLFSIKTFVSTLVLSFLFLSCAAQKDYGYEIIGQGVGSQGSALVKVYSYAKNYRKALEMGKRNAVDGVLFKGIVGGNGIAAQPAMVKPAEYEANRSFFKDFFDKGTYLRYVNVSSDGSVSAKDRLRVGNQYKIGIIVSVDKSGLRSYLESQGVIKSMGGMFD